MKRPRCECCGTAADLVDNYDTFQCWDCWEDGSRDKPHNIVIRELRTTGRSGRLAVDGGDDDER